MSFGGNSQSTSDERLNAIPITTSTYGSCVPLVYGTARIAGSLIWYGAFTATPHTEKQGGKGGGGSSSHTSYTYSAALAMMVAEGPTVGISNVWSDKFQDTLANRGFTLFDGLVDQATWSYLTTNFPSQAVPYSTTTYVANGSLQLGSGAALPNLSFEVQGLQSFGVGGVDAEPGDILTDYCENIHHGCNFPFIHSGALTLYKNYCIAMGFFLSPVEKAQRPAHQFITEMMKITNSAALWSGGKLKLIPYADQPVSGNGHTYTPDMSPLFSFSDDDFVFVDGDDPVRVSRRAPSETFNIVRVEYSDRSKEYNPAIAEAKDEQDISVRGERPMETVKFSSIRQKLIARQVAQIILQRQLYVINSYEFGTRPDYSLLEPMDLVAITDPGIPISNKLVRIVEITDDEEDNLTFVTEEVLVGTAGAPIYNWESAQGFSVNYNVAPGAAQAPYIFAAPPLLVGPDGGYEIWIAVTGPSAGNWGGCVVSMSLDGSRYEQVGRVLGAARYGTLTHTLPSGADPDSSNLLRVQLSNTSLDLTGGTTADADNMRSIMMVENEVVSYRDATLTGAGTYNFFYLRRGKYGSAITSHSAGAKFARLDGTIFRMPYDPGMVGQTIYFKFQSFNIYGGGLEDIAGVTAYSYVVSPNSGIAIGGTSGLTLAPRNSCAVVGDTIYKITTASSAWDSDCYSSETYSSGCALSFQANQTNGYVMVGLNSDPTTDQNYTSLDFAFELDSSGALSIYESGSVVGAPGAFGSYTTETVLRIEYDNQVVRYYKDGVLVRGVESAGRTFFLDSSFHTPGVAIRNVAFKAMTAAPTLPFIARGSCVASANSAEKLSNAASAYDSDVYSRASFASGCELSAQPAQTNKEITLGLNTDPTTDTNYTSVDYAWIFSSAGTLFIYESGFSRGTFGSYTASTVLAIKYDGERVQYFKDGVLVRTVHDRGKTFFMDLVFLDPGGKLVNLQFVPITTAETAQFNARGSCTCTSNSAMKLTNGSAAWDSDVYSSNTYEQGCQLSFQLDAVTSVGNYDCMVGLNSDPLTDQHYTSLDHAFEVHTPPGPTWTIHENGSSILSGSFNPLVDMLCIKYDGQNVQYFVAGVLVRSVENRGKRFFMDSSFFRPGTVIRNLEFGPLTTASSIPFIARGSCVSSFNAARKLASGSAAWDSDVYTAATYEAGCQVKFQPDQSNADIMIGLNSDPTTDQNYTSLDYCFYCAASGNYYIYESSSGTSALGSYTANSVFSIKYDGQLIRYYKDDVLVRTVESRDRKLFMDSSFQTPGCSVRNLEFTALTTAPSIPFIARGQCVATSNTAKKVGGAAAWDSDVYTAATYENGCQVSFQPDQTNGSLMIGLNSDPTTDQNYTSLDFSWYARGDGLLDIYENGSGVSSLGAYTTSTVLSIKYDGQLVQYYQDNTLMRTVEARGKKLFMDSSFHAPGASVRNLEFVPLTTAPSIPWVMRGNCVATATSIRKVGGSSAWDSDCYSYEAYANGCAVSFQAEQTTAEMMIGLNSDPTTDQNYTSLDHAFYLNPSGGLSVYENGSSPSSHGSYTTSTILSIIYDGRYVRYLKDGSVVRQVYNPGKTFFMDSSFATPGGVARNVYFVPSGEATPAPYLARGNCVVSDDNVQKVGGSSAWDSDCYSINGYANCHVTFKANQTNMAVMVGLNEDPLTDQIYTSINYAWYIAEDGNAYIYESGSNIGSQGTYTTSTVLALTYDGSNVRYYKDGNLVRTQSASGTLFMDSSFYTVGSGINSLRFGPTINLAVMDTPQIGNNAATRTGISNWNGVNTTSSFTGNLLITDGQLAMVGPKFDCTVIVTATVLAYVSSTTGASVAVRASYSDDNGSNYTYATSQVSIGDYSSLQPQSYTVQWQFSHSAANAGVNGIGGIAFNNTSGGGLTVTYGLITTQLEFVIR